MNKSKLNGMGNLAELYAAKAIKVTNTKNYKGVEYVCKTCKGYKIRAMGFNARGFAIEGTLEEEGRYQGYFYWRFANYSNEIVRDFLAHPEFLYNEEKLDRYIWNEKKANK